MGLAVGLSFLPAHPPRLWIADQVRNDVTMLGFVFTLAPVSGTGTGFGHLPSRERGNWLVVLDLLLCPALWILP